MIDWIAANLPILISLIIGIGLLVVEAFIPGFGVAGFCGVALEVVSVVLTYIQYGPIAALGILLIGLSVVAIVLSMSLRSVAKGKLSESSMVLRETESNEKGYRATEDLQVFLGREGQTVTILRPTGMAEFDGVKLNVMSSGEYIPADTKVKITRVEGSRILVQPMV